nr:unnamed protein product [Callosobruchus chinensis]
MRAISLVNKLEFDFSGNVVRNAIALGDLDNDGLNELAVGNSNGDVAVFKGQEKIQTISKLTFVSCIAIGDIMNQKKNILIIITADGWCHLYAAPEIDEHSEKNEKPSDEVDGQTQSTSGSGSLENLPTSDSSSNSIKSSKKNEKVPLVCLHMQRIPANSKSILLGDIDGDGSLEMVLGLTDRVVRSYKWVGNPHKPTLNMTDSSVPFEPSDTVLGKFVALNKWECANQIGSITLHHSIDGRGFLLIAQPGGTFMRINCSLNADHGSTANSEQSTSTSHSSSQGENVSGNVDYQRLGISRMRNPNISTEILGDLRCSHEKEDAGGAGDSQQCISKGRPYALATLDGTIMLVKDEVISWAIAVDHQIFALTKLDVTGNGADDIVVCSWDGQTYILDQEKNSVRFHLNEAVQAFESGLYSVSPDKPNVTCLVYVTFKNKIIMYYDIPIKDLNCKKFEPNFDKLAEVLVRKGDTLEEARQKIKNMDKKTKKELVEYLLYYVKS